MENTGYIGLSRQAGLLKELQIIANNIANASTTGFKSEGLVFSEHLEALDVVGDGVSIAGSRVRFVNRSQGDMSETGNPLDIAIVGDGFFQIETPNGDRLTRGGNFSVAHTGELVTQDGHFVLDQGGAPVFVPPDYNALRISEDGTISADGRPVAVLGIVTVDNPEALRREGGALFASDEAPVPVDNPQIRQGFLEGSNVNPVVELARMIEVQRAYELGQSLQDKEHERLRNAINILGRTG